MGQHRGNGFVCAFPCMDFHLRILFLDFRSRAIQFRYIYAAGSNVASALRVSYMQYMCPAVSDTIIPDEQLPSAEDQFPKMVCGVHHLKHVEFIFLGLRMALGYPRLNLGPRITL